mmetsp:Transcript_18082/g.59054  ORF Transcript_18082/g.59054 Transcript_18082/m.59054 type:complete len:232 (-) Transcript_18082:4014-4709(-)
MTTSHHRQLATRRRSARRHVSILLSTAYSTASYAIQMGYRSASAEPSKQSSRVTRVRDNIERPRRPTKLTRRDKPNPSPGTASTPWRVAGFVGAPIPSRTPRPLAQQHLRRPRSHWTIILRHACMHPRTWSSRHRRARAQHPWWWAPVRESKRATWMATAAAVMVAAMTRVIARLASWRRTSLWRALSVVLVQACLEARWHWLMTTGACASLWTEHQRRRAPQALRLAMSF